MYTITITSNIASRPSVETLDDAALAVAASEKDRYGSATPYARQAQEEQLYRQTGGMGISPVRWGDAGRNQCYFQYAYGEAY